MKDAENYYAVFGGIDLVDYDVGVTPNDPLACSRNASWTTGKGKVA
jgi:hypothetical protein